MNVQIQVPKHPASVSTLYRRKPTANGGLSVVHEGVKFTYLDHPEVVIHTTPDRGLHITSFEEFSASQEVSEKILHSDYHSGAVERANTLLLISPSYNLLLMNCQHLSSFIATGEATCGELQATICGMGLGWLIGSTSFKEQSLGIKVSLAIAGGVIAQGFYKTSRLKPAP